MSHLHIIHLFRKITLLVYLLQLNPLHLGLFSTLSTNLFYISDIKVAYILGNSITYDFIKMTNYFWSYNFFLIKYLIKLTVYAYIQLIINKFHMISNKNIYLLSFKGLLNIVACVVILDWFCFWLAYVWLIFCYIS